MKKIIAILCGITITTSAFAGSIYEIKATGKTPVIKSTRDAYYKTFTSDKVNGFVNIEINDEGEIESPCDAIFFGTFDGEKKVVKTTLNIEIANIYGKNKNEIELYFTSILDSTEIFFAGIGKLKKEKNAPDLCGDDDQCITFIRIDKINGNYVGITHDVLCDPCDDERTWIFNECLENIDDNGENDVTFGSWNLRYNKKITAKCNDIGFPECIEDRIPNKYKNAE